MRKPVVDYRQLRLNNVRSPQYRHLLLLLSWLVYFALYFLTENLIPESVCTDVSLSIDRKIPYCEWFIFAYIGWYVLIVWSLGYFALYNIRLFTGLQKFIIVTQAVAMVCYIFFPSSTGDLRQMCDVDRHNIATWIVGIIQSADTPTGVCPSLHVAYSLGIASTWLKEKQSSPRTRTLVVLFCLLVCVSVVFVKQHAFVDILAAVPVCILAEALVYGKSDWMPKFRRKTALKGNNAK